MNIQNMKITDIRPYEKNPRLNEGAVDAVAASIETPSSRGLDSNSRPLFSLPEKQKSGVVDIFD